MRGVAGLRGQVAALPLIFAGKGVARGPLPVRGIPSTKGIPLTATPANINSGGSSTTLISGVVIVTQQATRRGEAFRQVWTQISGLPGVVIQHVSGGVYFQHSGLPADATSSFVWRCTVDNQFGLGGHIDVAFTLTHTTPLPPLQGIGSPNTQQNVPVDPVNRIATVSFSVSVYSGVEPYSYNWVGGDSPFTASNSMSVHLPVGATEGIFIAPSCAVTDGAGRTINIPAGPYFFYEP